MVKQRTYGLQYDVVTDEDYVFGSSIVNRNIINPNADWTNFLPKKEIQNLYNVEPSACVSFTTLNCCEILIRYSFGRYENYSDRFLAKISDTQPQGNSPHKVAEFLRKVGVVLEEQWAFTPDIDSFDKYYEPFPAKLYDEAEKFKKKYIFKHEYVPTTTDYIKNALMTSPLGVSVTAWYQDENGMYFRPEGMPNNHFTTLVGFEEGSHWLVFDSYEQIMKKIPWETKFDIVKRYYLIEDNGYRQKRSLWQNIVNWFNDIFSWK